MSLVREISEDDIAKFGTGLFRNYLPKGETSFALGAERRNADLTNIFVYRLSSLLQSILSAMLNSRMINRWRKLLNMIHYHPDTECSNRGITKTLNSFNEKTLEKSWNSKQYQNLSYYTIYDYLLEFQRKLNNLEFQNTSKVKKIKNKKYLIYRKKIEKE